MKLELRDYQKEEIASVRESFRMGNRRVLAVLPCGAGKTVLFAYMSKCHIEKNPQNRVLFLVHRKELIDQTVETFDRFGLISPRIEIAMAQTVTRRLDKIERPTMIVLDEAHHSSATTWTRILNKFSDVPTIGLTATPCRLDGRGLGDIFSDMRVGVSPRWLIDNGYLSDYDYYAPKVNLIDTSWKPKGSDFDMEEAANTLRKSAIFGDVMKYLDFDRQTIVYCPTVAMSKEVADRIGDKATHFDGDTPKKERERIVREFREGKIRVLCNCDLIGEGFDVPDCDCVMLLRPTQSVGLYVQQSMRCLRPKPGKRATIYDFVGNCYRHGLPTDEREWSLAGKTKAKNPSGEPDIVTRQCGNCFRVYPGNDRICPYCGFDNGKTRAQIKKEEEQELERVTELQRRKDRIEQGQARTYDQLVALAIERGYKNPRGWAYMIIKARGGR